jgi:hypothetical protein
MAKLRADVPNIPPSRPRLDGHQAVASESGQIDFFSCNTSGWSSRYPSADPNLQHIIDTSSQRRVSVPAEKLSTTLGSRQIKQLDFLKVDVEGAEYDILLGDKDLWNTPISTLIVEADRTPRDARYSMNDLVELLKSKFRSVSIGNGNYPLITCCS